MSRFFKVFLGTFFEVCNLKFNILREIQYTMGNYKSLITFSMMPPPTTTSPL